MPVPTETKRSPGEDSAGPPPLEPLILRLQDGDESALEPLIRLTQGMAGRLARTVLRDRHQCEDAVQDSYLIVYREVRSLRDPRAFKSWFSRIVLNRCRRLARGRPVDSLEDLTEGQVPRSSGDEETVQRRLDLRQALSHLSDLNRSVLMLREVAQLSYDEIAKALQVPVGTVRSRLSEARRRLVEAWEGPPPADGPGPTARSARKAPLSVLLGLLATLARHVSLDARAWTTTLGAPDFEEAFRQPAPWVRLGATAWAAPLAAPDSREASRRLSAWARLGAMAWTTTLGAPNFGEASRRHPSWVRLGAMAWAAMGPLQGRCAP